MNLLNNVCLAMMVLSDEAIYTIRVIHDISEFTAYHYLFIFSMNRILY